MHFCSKSETWTFDYCSLFRYPIPLYRSQRTRDCVLITPSNPSPPEQNGHVCSWYLLLLQRSSAVPAVGASAWVLAADTTHTEGHLSLSACHCWGRQYFKSAHPCSKRGRPPKYAAMNKGRAAATAHRCNQRLPPVSKRSKLKELQMCRHTFALFCNMSITPVDFFSPSVMFSDQA